MSRQILTVIAAATILLAITSHAVPAQTPARDDPPKATEKGEGMRDYTVEKKDEAVAYARKLVADLDTRIEQLTRASRASWEHAKQGFADAYRDLAQAFEKAAGEFRR